MRRFSLAAVTFTVTLSWTATAATVDKKFSALEAEARHVLSQEPKNASARFQLARVLAWQSRFIEARKHYELLLRVEPDNADYLLGLAQVHLWAKHPARALPVILKARQKAPDYADAWQVHIQALLGIGDVESVQQAGALRTAARKRFPQRNWTFAALDSPATVAVAPPIVTVTPAPPAGPSVGEVPRVASNIDTAASVAAAPVPAVAPMPLESAATSPPAALQESRIEGEITTSREHLTKGLPDWTSNAVFASWRDGERRSWYGGWRDVRRYNLNDTEAHVGTVQPLGNNFSLQAEAGSSGSHRFLARSYGQISLIRNFGTDWLFSAGWKESHFDAGKSVLGTFALERTLNNYRLGYTLYEGRPEGAGFSPSHRIHLSRDYGDRNVMSLSLTDGRETESSGTGRFISSSVSGVSLSGRHWFSPDWAVSWEALQQKQGELYTRKGFNLGLRRAF